MAITPDRCKKTVLIGDGFHSKRCSKKAVRDGFCTIHHPDTIKSRHAIRQAEFDKKSNARRRAWQLQGAASDMLAALKELLCWFGPGSAASNGCKCDTLEEAKEQAAAAIAKAEGRQE